MICYIIRDKNDEKPALKFGWKEVSTFLKCLVSTSLHSNHRDAVRGPKNCAQLQPEAQQMSLSQTLEAAAPLRNVSMKSHCCLPLALLISANTVTMDRCGEDGLR